MSSSWAKLVTEAGIGRRRLEVGGIGLVLLLAGTAFAQDQHVTWTVAPEPSKAAPGSKILLHMAAKVDEGWHLYSMSTRGANPTKISLTGAVVGAVRPLQPKAIVANDPNFGVDTEFYEKEAAFL